MLFCFYGQEACPSRGHHPHDGWETSPRTMEGAGMHLIQYEDGDEKWYDLRGKEYCLESEYDEYGLDAPTRFYGRPGRDEQNEAPEDTWELCSDESELVGEVVLGAGQEAVRDGAGAYEFLLEKRPSHYARWPRATGSGGAEAVGTPRRHSYVRDVIPGTIGLRNLGNTCYMNASIQVSNDVIIIHFCMLFACSRSTHCILRSNF